MEIKPVSEVLAPVGMNMPTLNALMPDEANYRVLLMQPRGEVEASIAGVRNRDRILAQQQFESFLGDARETQADLVITPEYSMPWNVLMDALTVGIVPAQGKLWALGCESIKYSELEALKRNLAPSITIICEPLQPDPERFTDPLAYVFLAPPKDNNDAARIVVLVQFKTYPMGDDNHFEINGLQLGTWVYEFGDLGQNLRLVSLICSDVFAFRDAHAQAIYDRALVIHIQLNQSPRQTKYRQYRDRLFNYSGDATELICVNWAKNVHEWCGERTKPWNNIAGSAWYLKSDKLKSDKFDDGDATLCDNHRRGLYYTWFHSLRSHALFFNYEPATYLLKATKVAHIGVPGPISRRRGPTLTRTCHWSNAASAWIEQSVVDDSFSTIVSESGDAKDNIQQIAIRNPLEAERVLALCMGKIGPDESWHNVHLLDSFSIGIDEIILRLTFCQDTDQHAREFRIARLKRCGILWNILNTEDQLPPALRDFINGFSLAWDANFPHQNATSTLGDRATVIYLGEESNEEQIEAIFKRAAAFLQRGFSDPKESRSARQRLAVWYRGEDGQINRFGPDRFVRYDSPDDVSEFDIARQT